MPESFSSDWLARREPHDAAARSAALARALATVLPRNPRLVDLGAGTGSLFRWLAPILAGPQSWTLVDADATLLARAFDDTADWAAARGFATSRTTFALTIHTLQGAWRLRAEAADLANLPALGLNRHHAVVCSALLDIVSAPWIATLAATLKRPLLACLSVDGRDAFLPTDPADRLVRAGFRRDQGRDKGLGPALGPRAPAALAAALRGRGFDTRAASTPWRIPARDADMLDLLVAAYAEAAARHLPTQRPAIRAWAARRAAQANRARLAIRLGHTDTLALPPGTPMAPMNQPP